MIRRLALLVLVVAWAAALAPAGAQPAPVARLYLPVIGQAGGPPATVRFGATMSDGVLGDVGTTFPAGLPALYYEVSVPDGAGQPFRLEWAVDGLPRPELGRAGTLPADGAPLTGGVARTTGEPLPRGVYALRVLVGGLPSGGGVARVE